MASETHNVKKRNFYNNIEDHSIDRPRKRISNFTNKNMKEVKKSPKQLAAYINRPSARNRVGLQTRRAMRPGPINTPPGDRSFGHYGVMALRPLAFYNIDTYHSPTGTVGHAVKSPDKLRKVIYHRKKVHYPFPNSCFKKKQSPRSGGCDMANKENELACAGHLPEKLHHDSRTYLLNSSDSGSSQTESASSKYSGFFSEVSQDHETMAQVLFSRNLRLNVALTFWKKRSISELVAYLVRIEDLGVVVDCLPVLTNSLQEEKQYISLGCCVDLLPLVKSLLKSKFEEYIIVGLNWLQAVIKRWWSELSSKTEIINDGNIQILKQQLSRLWEQENHLTLVPGYTGNIAKDVDAYLLQLH